MTPTAVINIVGLSQSLLSEHSPRILEYAKRGQLRRLIPDTPAVTCTVQSSMLTGTSPSQHGIVGNGWYNHEQCEVQFWKQSNKLVKGDKVWDIAKRQDPSFRCLNMFWWYNMYATVDYSCTPRPIYKADGRKIPDCYAEPPELRDELQSEFGRFPLFSFWGPGSSMVSSRWITDASMYAARKYDPTLTLIYLPHLDYCLQKFGPEHESIPERVTEIDTAVGELIDFFDARGTRVILLSEYGIEPVHAAIPINRKLRQEGAIRFRDELGHEMLDPGASEAFAVVDHQVAHVYVKDKAKLSHFALFCRALPGVEHVYNKDDQARLGISHQRSGDLVLVAAEGRWFSYPWWLDDRKAPDYARTVDIHHKPGYDPLELFLDPHLLSAKARVAGRLFQRKILKQRALLDVIPLDTSLVKGSHGRPKTAKWHQPVLITHGFDHDEEELPCQSVRDVILSHLFSQRR